MDTVTLDVSARSKDLTPAAMRRGGQVPCIVYGNKVENTNLQCEERALRKAYAQAGDSSLVQLKLGDKSIPALFQSLAFDAVSDRMIHVDFYAVDMKKEVEAEVVIRLEGEAPAVKNLSAVLITPLSHVLVRCLPGDLPHDLPVNLDSLVEFDSSISVKDIVVPKGVTILTEPDMVIALAQEPRAGEVVEAPAAPAEGEAAAATAEGAEGAAAADAEKKEE